MLKPQDLSIWLLTVLVTVTILAIIPQNVEGLICYSCKTPGGGLRVKEGNQQEQKLSDAKADTGNTEGNASGRVISNDCGTTQPSNTIFCSGDCFYQIQPKKDGGTYYFRNCALVEDHKLGCKKYESGTVNCYCDKSYCNNKLSYDNALRSSQCNTTLLTLGLLLVILLSI